MDKLWYDIRTMMVSFGISLAIVCLSVITPFNLPKLWEVPTENWIILCGSFLLGVIILVGKIWRRRGVLMAETWILIILVFCLIYPPASLLPDRIIPTDPNHFYWVTRGLVLGMVFLFFLINVPRIPMEKKS